MFVGVSYAFEEVLETRPLAREASIPEGAERTRGTRIPMVAQVSGYFLLDLAIHKWPSHKFP